MRTTCTRSCFIVPKVKSGLPRSAIASSCMPMSMWRAACAAGTARAAAKTRIAAKTPICLRNDRLPSEAGQHPPQPVLELNFRLPVEELLCARNVRLPHLRIVNGKRLVDDLALRSGDAEDRVGEALERELARVAEIDGKVLVRFGECDEAPDQVVDVTEAPCLGAITEHRQRLALQGLSDKRRNRTAVLWTHERPVGAEDSRDRRVDALLAVIGHRQRLAIALRLVV